MDKELLDKIWEKINDMDSKINNIDKRLKDVENDVSGIKDIIGIMNEKLDKIESRQYTNSRVINENRLDISDLKERADRQHNK